MRNRHIPRLCRSCGAPMAGHQDACWRCDVPWAPEEAPRTTLRLVPSTAPGQAERMPLEAAARSASQTQLDAERWTNAGGSFAANVAAAVAAVSAGR